MQKIMLNGLVLGYEKDKRDIVKYLPDVMVTKVEVSNGGKDRVMKFENGDELSITTIDKDYGAKGGDICTLCKQGELKEYGGCATCENCSAQLKCGL